MKRFAFALALAASACATAREGAQTEDSEPEYSATRSDAVQTDVDSAYQQCLNESQAVAMAWEAIEQMCRERSGGKDPLTPEEK